MGRTFLIFNCLAVVSLFFCVSLSTEQRITTIQLDGVQYFISRMNPYSPELNYFLAYQYCRSLGLQLASFETKEKADSITQYLANAGYGKFDFWTSGNRLGTDMFLWMSTGLPFNATFNYMKRPLSDEDNNSPYADLPIGSTSPQRTGRENDSGSANGCVVLKAPTFEWDTDDCVSIKDFICEQTRCYYYNYGSIPVSTAQGRARPSIISIPTSSTQIPSSSTTTPAAASTTEPNNINNNFLDLKSLMNKLLSTTQISKKSHNSIEQQQIQHQQQQQQQQQQPVLRPYIKLSDLDQSTNGPYDNNFNVKFDELHQDDPNAGIILNSKQDDTYISTIEPDQSKDTTANPHFNNNNPSINSNL